MQRRRYHQNNFAINAMLAESNLRAGNTDEAILVLRQLLANYHSAPSLWNMLAESYGKRGYVGRLSVTGQYY